MKKFEKSCLLITDNSSIDMEYVFLFKRPIVYLDYVPKIHNNQNQLIKSEDIDVEFKKIFGNTLIYAQIGDKLIKVYGSNIFSTFVFYLTFAKLLGNL